VLLPGGIPATEKKNPKEKVCQGMDRGRYALGEQKEKKKKKKHRIHTNKKILYWSKEKKSQSASSLSGEKKDSGPAETNLYAGRRLKGGSFTAYLRQKRGEKKDRNEKSQNICEKNAQLWTRIMVYGEKRKRKRACNFKTIERGGSARTGITTSRRRGKGGEEAASLYFSRKLDARSPSWRAPRGGKI